jgi:transposase-like protein
MPKTPVGSPFNCPRWTESQAHEVIAALARSGKSVNAFAAEHGLDPQRVYLWRRRVAGGDGTRFREIVVRPSAAVSVADRDGPFEVVLASGVVVRVPASFDAVSLSRLLEVLAQARAC